MGICGDADEVQIAMVTGLRTERRALPCGILYMTPGHMMITTINQNRTARMKPGADGTRSKSGGYRQRTKTVYAHGIVVLSILHTLEALKSSP